METLTDLVFASRNRAYGAYTLRTGYARTLRRAALLGTLATSLGLTTPLLLGTPSAEKPRLVLADPMKLPPPPAEQPVTPPPLPPPNEAPAVKTSRFLPPEITVEDVPDELPPTQEELQKAPASDQTRNGDLDPNEVVEVPTEAGPGKNEVVEIKPEDTKIFTTVEQQPQFPGGIEALGKFLAKQLRYPGEASRSEIAGKVHLEFIVRPDGSIDNVRVQKGIGFGCDEEALRVVRLMPRWQPGKQSGRAVPVKFNLPIGFVLE